ncbi:MAG: hypothetical protein J6S02_08405 [Bacteroidaceae bacterium]|nr:hypothetical protein [Bacteroidaceae bacterium]
MRKISTLLVMLCAFIGAWAQYYTPGARTTTLEAGKKYFISAATFYGNARPNLLYNNAGNLAYSESKPAGAMISSETYLFTVEEVGEGNVYYIKNSDGKYLQSNTLESTETKTGITVVSYNSVKGTVSCGNDVQACDENGNKIEYNAITGETPIVCVYHNNDNGWRHISGLQIGKSTPFAFYVADEASVESTLAVTIEEAEALLETVGVSKVNLQVTNPEAAGYLSSNADQNTGGGNKDGAGIAGLIDGKIDDPNYFHTRWGGTNPNEAHYVQVDLGAGNAVDNIVFEYNVRKAGNANNTSPAPTIIKVYAGNEANAVSTLIATVTSSDAENPLPAYTQLGAKWTSNVIEAGAAYRYFRFVVEESNGPGGKKFGDYYFFCMAEFGLSTQATNELYEGRETLVNALETAVAEAKVVAEGSDTDAKLAAKNKVKGYLNDLSVVYPFKLTANTPNLYALKSGRTNDGKEWWYTYTNDNKIKLTQFNAADEQLWYFKETLDANNKCVLQLFPKLGGGKAMSYENTNDAADKIVAQELNTTGWTNTWVLVNTNGNAPYGLQTADGANYLSNNGGVQYNMGMWNAAPNNDGGSAIYFVNPADVINDLIAEAESKMTIVGTAIGYYTPASVESLSVANEAAKASLEAKNYGAAFSALNTALAGLELVLPTPGKVYTIKSASTNGYCAGKYVCTIPTSVERNGSGSPRVYNHQTLIFDELANVQPTALWVFTEDMKIQNVHTGEFVKSFNSGAQHMGSKGEAKSVAISALGEGQVDFRIDGNYPMHAQADYGVIVVWSGGKNSASAWRIEEVTEFSHTATITEAGYSTLVLGFNAEIPNGVEAYAVTAAGDGVAEMTQVTGVLPANQAVILKGAAKDHEFAYTTETATVEGNLLKGTLFSTNIAAEAYVLGNNDGVGLFKATLNQAENSAFLNNANKAYLLASDVVNTPQGTLRFNFGGTTAIESVLNNGIDANAPIYDLSGRRVNNAVKGIYIQNGKKIIVK